jgi:hypothetical protein
MSFMIPRVKTGAKGNELAGQRLVRFLTPPGPRLAPTSPSDGEPFGDSKLPRLCPQGRRESVSNPFSDSGILSLIRGERLRFQRVKMAQKVRTFTGWKRVKEGRVMLRLEMGTKRARMVCIGRIIKRSRNGSLIRSQFVRYA